MLFVVLFALIQSCVKSENLFQKLVHSTSSESPAVDKCQLQLKLLENGVGNPWTSKMLDSWSSFRTEITNKGSSEFGNFDQCMSIHQVLEDGDVFEGQYCMIQFYSKLTNPGESNKTDSNFGWKNVDTRFGGATCIPASCPPEVIESAMERKFNGSDLMIAQDYDQKHFCKKRIATSRISNSLAALACVTTALVMIAIIALSYDLKTRKMKPNDRSQLLLSFSPYNNALNLFNFKRQDSIGCLNGIRVMSTMFIVLFHSVFNRITHPAQNIDQMSQFSQSSLGLFIFGLQFNVDSFFVMSGCLITKAILRDLDSKRFNIFKLFFQRYMRLTPSLAFIILVSICSGQYLVQHAAYAFSNVLIEPCQRHWLSTLLHFQVYENPKDFCMLTTWYLSVEWQMFVLAPFVIYPCWKVGRKVLLTVLPALVMVSFGYTWAVAWNNHFMVKDNDISTGYKEDAFQALYIPTHVRGSAFLIGMILGFFLSLKRDVYEKLRRSSLLISTVWTVVIVIALGPYTFLVLGYWTDITSRFFNSLYISCFRIIYAVILSWCIFALEIGSVQKVNAFLSHRYWIPIGKLGLSIYLVHPVLQDFRILSQAQPDSFDSMHMMWNFWTDLVLTVLFSLPLYFLVEEPFSQLARVLVSTPRADQKQTSIAIDRITS